MKAWLIAVGTGMPAWVQDGFAEYAKRLAHSLPLQLIELVPGERSKSRDPQRAIDDEAKRLLAAVPKGAAVVLLDGRGKAHSSEALSERLQYWRMQGRDLAFLIGGPDGFAQSVRDAASESWSLGPMTAASLGPGDRRRAVVPRRQHPGESSLPPRWLKRGLPSTSVVEKPVEQMRTVIPTDWRGTGFCGVDAFCPGVDRCD